MYKTNNKKIAAIIEARMTSTRLPGKVLLPLAGKPAIQHIIERLKRSEYLDDIVVATTVNGTDDPLVEFVEGFGVNCFRGSEQDVLERVLGAAHNFHADVIVEITADCPMIDHGHVDYAIQKMFEGDYDFVANCTTVPLTFPDGFDVRVLPTRVLERVDKLTNDPIDRVHVTYYIWTHRDKFKIFEWTADTDSYGPELRVTLDEKKDSELLDKIFSILIEKNEDFSCADVVSLLRSNKALVNINKEVRAKQANEG
jgi:spore coat polysaccharide biosynthesis protein SpsF